MDNKIKHALYLEGWIFADGDKTQLRAEATRIVINEYTRGMKGKIFCPECSGNLFRSPEINNHSKNGRKAYFAHSRGVETTCNLRTKSPEGKRYLTEEDARQALHNHQLAIVNSFMSERPEISDVIPREYDATVVEDVAGPLSAVPIARARGETFNLPSRITTVRAICTNFDQKIECAFLLPNSQYAIPLRALLINIESVTETDDIPRLYYGEIIRSSNRGSDPTHIRMTELKYYDAHYRDFYLKLPDGKQCEKGINDSTRNRFLLVYGKVVENGMGLSINNPSWGEFALLPEQYNDLIRSL